MRASRVDYRYKGGTARARGGGGSVRLVLRGVGAFL